MSDLTISPEFPITKRPTFSTLNTRFENGVEQSRPRRLNVINEWDLVYRNRPASDQAALIALNIAKYDAAIPFTWDNPEEGVTYTVRFKEGSFQQQLKMYNLWDIQFTLVQVL